jgi:2-polyprenyl-3-methyl-5-hydroxy-6-metoxy-1,4-benzoquinol methylase
MIPHIMRYAWATQFCWQKRVVDLGCGSGYGSFILSMVAKEVIGADLSIDAIIYAGDNFEADNLFFTICDLENDELPLGEVYAAFEVLEHLEDPAALVQMAKPLVWSIPISNKNQWHKQVLSMEEIESLMGEVAWVQSGDGQIAPRETANFEPVYALGGKP